MISKILLCACSFGSKFINCISFIHTYYQLETLQTSLKKMLNLEKLFRIHKMSIQVCFLPIDGHTCTLYIQKQKHNLRCQQ